MLCLREQGSVGKFFSMVARNTLCLVLLLLVAGSKMGRSEDFQEFDFSLHGGSTPAAAEWSIPIEETALIPEAEPLEDPAEAEKQAALQQEKILHLFQAVLQRDAAGIREALESGLDPDSPLPSPAPAEFVEKLQNSQLVYYATKEEGFTALMLAAAIEYEEGAALLIEGGADRWKKTKKHKTYALWLASKTDNLDLMRLLMGLRPGEEWEKYRITVDLAGQRMILWRENELVMESSISSGKSSQPTPVGRFLVTDKHRNWRSTLYNVPMPHFVRLSCSDFGFHAGRLPGHPASRGCIRLPADAAKQLFATVPLGTLVEIE